MTAAEPVAPDVVLRGRILDALREVEISAGIRSRIPYSRFVDAVLGIAVPGGFDVVFHDGIHLYSSSHCRHGNSTACDSDGQQPAQCPGCGAACRHTYVDLQNEGP